MITRHTKKEVDNYFASKDLNQSKLKKIIDGIDAFNEASNQSDKTLYYEERGHFIVGSGVDQMLSNPDDFDKLYFYGELDKPGDSLLALAHIVMDTLPEDKKDIDIRENEFKEIVHGKLQHIKYYDKDYKKDWTKDSRMGRIEKTSFYNYCETLRQAAGKQIIDIDEKRTIFDVYYSLTENPVTSEYFIDKPDCDIHFQLPLYFEYRGIKCKVLIDRLEINNRNKTIKIADFKTLFDKTTKFIHSMKLRRYDIQIAFYQLAVFIAIINSKSGRYKDYTLVAPEFVVESTGEIGKPLVYIATEEILYMGKHGRLETYSNFMDAGGDVRYSKLYPELWGYDRCIDELEWYVENGAQTDRLIVESGGRLNIDWSKAFI